MVEQGTHKPLDVGSNPTLATKKSPKWEKFTQKGLIIPCKTCQTAGFRV